MVNDVNRTRSIKLAQVGTLSEGLGTDPYEGTSLDAIGRRLQLVRRVHGMAQNEFCARAGLATNTYNQYEKGKKRPSVENAIALCEQYGLTLDWIYRGETAGLRFAMSDAINSLRKAVQTV